MKDIQILIKPDYISYGSICEVIAKAHSTLENDNIGKLSTTNILPEELQEKIGTHGQCIIAIDNNKLIGCQCATIGKIDAWFFNGEILTSGYLAVLPEYRGQGIAKKMKQKLIEILKKRKSEIIISKIRVKNKVSLKGSRSAGFIPVHSYIGYGGHACVITAYWFNGCPYSKFYCNMRYHYSKTKTKLKIYCKTMLKR